MRLQATHFSFSKDDKLMYTKMPGGWSIDAVDVECLHRLEKAGMVPVTGGYALYPTRAAAVDAAVAVLENSGITITPEVVCQNSYWLQHFPSVVFRRYQGGWQVMQYDLDDARANQHFQEEFARINFATRGDLVMALEDWLKLNYQWTG